MHRPIPHTWRGRSPDGPDPAPAAPLADQMGDAGGGMSAGRLQEFKLHVVTLQRSLAILLESYRSRQPDDGRGDPSAPAIRDDPGAKGFLSDNSS